MPIAATKLLTVLLTSLGLLHPHHVTPQPSDTLRVQPVAHYATHHHHRPAYQRWAHSTYAVRIANCESGGGYHDTSRHYDGNPHLHNQSTYTGKWQMGPTEWRGTGGHGAAWPHSERTQNKRAYRLYKDRGWEPWSCSGLV